MFVMLCYESRSYILSRSKYWSYLLYFCSSHEVIILRTRRLYPPLLLHPQAGHAALLPLSKSNSRASRF